MYKHDRQTIHAETLPWLWNKETKGGERRRKNETQTREPMTAGCRPEETWTTKVINHIENEQIYRRNRRHILKTKETLISPQQNETFENLLDSSQLMENRQQPAVLWQIEDEPIQSHLIDANIVFQTGPSLLFLKMPPPPMLFSFVGPPGVYSGSPLIYY